MKLKNNKILLLKLFVLQQKNKLFFNITLQQHELLLLISLWKSGYILGFTCRYKNVYTIFFKKQFKQFSIEFFEYKLNFQAICSYHKTNIVNSSVILSSKGINLSNLLFQSIGGFLLCNIF